MASRVDHRIRIGVSSKVELKLESAFLTYVHRAGISIRSSTEPILCIKFIDDDKTIHCDEKCELILSDLITRRVKSRYATKKDQMVNLDVSLNNLLCNYKNVGFEILDLESFTPFYNFDGERPTFCFTLFTNSGLIIGPGPDSKNIMLIDIRSNRSCIFQSEGHGKLMACHLIDDHYIFGAYEDGNIVFFENTTRLRVSEYKLTNHEGEDFI
ncbi:hypothetical protein RF11_01465 [Thelohanellus kitauei]|uniref:Uncharacterized protein n=1 Tax=Thelohanellus kitauei TaxID=669202 RepID=A0A0C2MC56_THEKT|nr:hypothetical protein RF11_01465 [Thelohanellus kitauei]